ncbi:uncharacterized protein LOC119767490 [Culex quinquefasciatus]|uniref:uncharacterized protein LOC119767490 n=1 Tax=Culex quinquefasciatus TaxID=7176 RepID=UPI00016D6F97|nr:uncharacterized protein LOC119767490 [Culex quinquefasciatus]XP_039439229.1 uncharacterized protein LOC120420297 [Culex pipiens pallens]
MLRVRTLIFILNLTCVILAQVPTGCVKIHNRELTYSGALIKSDHHDKDRRHVSFNRWGEPWIITKVKDDMYTIKHAGTKEEMFESVQKWNGNYIFTWIPKTIINDGGAWWRIYPSKDGYFYIKNVKFNHCLYAKIIGDWVAAYPECNSSTFEWRIFNLNEC